MHAGGMNSSRHGHQAREAPPAPARSDVAYTSRELGASPSQAFAALVDPQTYPQWLVGTNRIRDVDDTWPQRGSQFHHVVGVGPIRIADATEVLDIEPDALLRLRVRARPLIAAVVTFRVVGADHTCVVSIEEEPALRTIGNIVRPVMDPAIHVRNHRSLGRLAAVVEGQRQSVGPSGGPTISRS
jgi:uncharacterized protein YndB with AHSA1/START domain